MPLTHYGWPKDVWSKNHQLKKEIFKIASFERNKNFVAVKHINEMKYGCKKAHLTKDFHKHREEEKVVFYKPSYYNECLAIFYHIRNSLAHGRWAMYPTKENDDIIFALEDGVKKGNKFQVRFRMIVKKSTLIKWIDLLEKGHISKEQNNE